MKEELISNNFNENASLSEEEASDLAAELKGKGLKEINLKRDKVLIKRIVAGLSDNRGKLRRTFSESLGLIGEEAIPFLRIVLLNSQNVIARRAAAKTLRLIGHPSALPDLLEALLNDEDPVVQGSSVGAMAIFGEEAIEHFLKVLENPISSEMQCGLVGWGLAYVGAKGGRALKKASFSSNIKVRAYSVAALGEQIQSFSDKEAKSILSNALNDKSEEVQIEAIKLIGLLEEQTWNLSLLASKLEHNNPEIRKQSALSLMKLNATNQVEKLKSSLSKEKNIELKNIFNLSINSLTN